MVFTTSSTTPLNVLNIPPVTGMDCWLLEMTSSVLLTCMDEENSVTTETSWPSGHLGDHAPHRLASIGGIHGNTSRTGH